jgi:hypothetical protein
VTDRKWTRTNQVGRVGLKRVKDELEDRVLVPLLGDLAPVDLDLFEFNGKNKNYLNKK